MITGRILIAFGICVYFSAYVFYGRYLKKLFAVDPHRPTPAHTLSDNVDFVPTKPPILFGHHFASIAGAGPIVGPVLGVCFGWGPVLLWLVFGCVFIGAVHDFAALMASVRNKGQTIGHVIEKYISYPGRQIFLLFCLAALVLIIAIFALLIAKTFVATPSVATSSILFILLAVVFGLVNQRGHLPLWANSLIFLPFMAAAIYVGVKFPFDLTSVFGLSAETARAVWLGGLAVYIFAASVLPVWVLLQPRDYLNSFLLYALVGLGIISILVVSPPLKQAFFEGFRVPAPTAENTQWSLFPILFVTVACGACSGFHALVASGTTSKQLDTEQDAFPIGYGGMLLEGILGIIALVAVAMFNRQDYLMHISGQGVVNAFAFGLAELSSRIGLPFDIAKTFIALTISAFMLTTLDTATRLTRFTMHEFALPRLDDTALDNPFWGILKNRYSATFIVLLIAGYLALSGDAQQIWPVFGASNQLLAALTLLVLTYIFIVEKKPVLVVFIPFIIMLAISGWALVELLFNNLTLHHWGLCITSGFLILIAVVMTGYAAYHLWKKKFGGSYDG